jgi:chemotaxis protein methyltransferase CheR
MSVMEMDLREFKLLRSLVHKHTGIWLKDGKQVMLASRLSRRLRQHGLSSFGAYYDYVQAHLNDTDELRELINCVTTNKTSFFREPHHFEFLAKKLVPHLLSHKAPGNREPIRIWSAACSTGEEPYSIAITLAEALEARRNSASISTASRTVSAPEIEIVASDIDTRVLATASGRIYREESVTGIDRALLKKYFLRGKGNMSGQVCVKPELARNIEFLQINLVASNWPLSGPFDAIFFRNALIYFQQETQNSILRRMAGLLAPGGYLFLGNSEHISWLNDIYEPMKQTMYRLRKPAS